MSGRNNGELERAGKGVKGSSVPGSPFCGEPDMC